MQSTIHVVSNQDVDVHAPAKTYYTTGSNAGGFISRLKSFTVCLCLLLMIKIKVLINLYI